MLKRIRDVLPIQRFVDGIADGTLPALLKLPNLQFGRVFRKMGLPPWTLAGIGVSAIWFNYVGALCEKVLRDLLGLNAPPTRWIDYLPPVIILIIPFLAVIGLSFCLSMIGYRCRKIPHLKVSCLQFLLGKGSRGGELTADSLAVLLEIHSYPLSVGYHDRISRDSDRGSFHLNRL
jgi:hypothetical protein